MKAKSIFIISLSIALNVLNVEYGQSTEKNLATASNGVLMVQVTAADTPIAKQLADIALADHGKPRKRIVILGAGMAGISAAIELKKLGHTVEIFEASDRIGGRVWTHRFKNGQYHELGAMRIPQAHDYTRHYITECGLELRRFITSHKNVKGFYHFRGKVSRIGDAPSKILDSYALSSHEREVANERAAPAIFGMHLDNVVKSLTHEDKASLFGETFLTERAAQLDSLSLGEFLEQRLGGEDAKELIGVTTGLEVWWDKALSMFIRDELTGTGEGLEEIIGGMDKLPTTLVEKHGLGDNIKTKTEVVSIKLQKDGKAKVRIREGDKTEEIGADHVICTIPFSVLRGMELEGLSSHKMRAIRNLHYTSSTKVLLNCTERFWETEDGIFGGASLSDEITRSTFYPSDHVASITPGKDSFHGLFTQSVPDTIHPNHHINVLEPGVLVGSYNWGRDARRLASIQGVERAETVVRVLEKFHPHINKFLKRDEDWYASIAWDDYPWSRGAFCFMRPNDLRDHYHAAICAEGNLHFAGEHCSLDQAWIQGAIKSGMRVVEEIVKQ